MTKNWIKKILLSLFLIFFLLQPVIASAEELTETAKNAATTGVGIVSGIMLLNPTMWPLGIAFQQISQTLGGGSSNKCNESNFITDPYCAIAKIIIDVQRSVGSSIVTVSQILLTQSTNSDILTQASSENNVIVQAGWGIVRNIANAALVIGLIIIAITIILGYQENKAKQVLINFILIALLINFTPVICGFIIDGANVITSSFLSGGTNTGFAGAIEQAYGLIEKATNKNPLDKIVLGTILFIFSIVASVIMFLYSLLFMARTVILWILVIVSPIAFATKVFPQSKYIKKIFPSITYWDDWWESFIQWAVIGIPAAISLYLSMYLTAGASAGLSAMTSNNILDTLMPFATPFIFMIAGFFITISSGGQVGAVVGGLAAAGFAATAGRAIGWGKEKAKAGGEWAFEGAKRTAAGAALGALEGGAGTEGFKDLAKGVFKGAVMGGLTPAGRERAEEEIAKGKENIGWSKRGEYASKRKGEIDESEKRMSNLSETEQREILYSTAITKQGGIDKVGALKELTKNGKLKTDDLNFLASNKKMFEALGADLKEVSKARPDYAPQLINKAPSEVLTGMSPSEAGKKINSGAFASPNVLFSTHYNVINGKIKKGSAEDIKNIQDGLITELNNYLGSIPGANFQTITRDNLDQQTQNNWNHIENYLETLRNDNTEASKRKEQTLSELLNHVYYGNI